MKTQPKDGYMLLFRNNEWPKSLSPNEMQRVFDQWMGWFNGLKEEGKAVAGNPLEAEGRVVSRRDGDIVTDGIFAESKEAVAGYFLLNVDTMDEAETIARGCPGLPYGATVEVRPVAAACPLSEATGEEDETSVVEEATR